jgi:hypothetical protein
VLHCTIRQGKFCVRARTQNKNTSDGIALRTSSPKKQNTTQQQKQQAKSSYGALHNVPSDDALFAAISFDNARRITSLSIGPSFVISVSLHCEI